MIELDTKIGKLPIEEIKCEQCKKTLEFSVIENHSQKGGWFVGLECSNCSWIYPIVEPVTKVEMMIVRDVLTNHEDSIEILNRITKRRNKLNRQISTLKKANLVSPIPGEKEFNDWVTN